MAHAVHDLIWSADFNAAGPESQLIAVTCKGNKICDTRFRGVRARSGGPWTICLGAGRGAVASHKLGFGDGMLASHTRKIVLL